MLSILALAMTSLILTACGDKSGGNNTTATTPLSAYYNVYKGQCFDDADRKVDAKNCEGLQGYYEVNGYCYSPADARVSQDYCRRYPSRVRPQCDSKEFYYMSRGKRFEAGCHKHGGCRGRNIFERDGRGTYCR